MSTFEMRVRAFIDYRDQMANHPKLNIIYRNWVKSPRTKGSYGAIQGNIEFFRKYLNLVR